MEKLNILRNSSFGERIAEQERERIKEYFVETDAFRRISKGEIDIIKGAKGSGKSAIYSILTDRLEDFSQKNIALINAEKPRGNPVFKNLETDPPSSPEEFIMMWKLYLSLIVSNYLIENGIRGDKVNRVMSLLREMELIPEDKSILNYILYAVDYVKRIFRPDGVEAGMSINENSGAVSGFTFKIIPGEPKVPELKAGIISIDSLLSILNEIFTENSLTIWILIDRLDVAFTENPELENRALRALFRVYLDMIEYEQIHLKIFLRDDIWDRITNEGFREASHIVKQLTLKWSKPTIINLIIRRLLSNDLIEQYYNVQRDKVLMDIHAQNTLFKRVFPSKIELGKRQSYTYDWIHSRVTGADDKITPREIIHLMNVTKDLEIKRIEVGETEAPAEQLFSRQAIKEAINPVSVSKLTQTIYAEYPSLRSYIEMLSNQRTEQSYDSLKKLWAISDAELSNILESLVNIGFFQKITTRDKGIRYKVPFLYRPALNMVQGSVDNQ